MNPCGYTFEFLDSHPNLVGDGGLCIAFKRGSKTERCGEPAIDHPHAPPGNEIILFSLSENKLF